MKLVLLRVAMIAGMAALMAYRWDRYAHGTHGRPNHEGGTEL